MEVTKFGENYTITDSKSTYEVNGNIIKALNGEYLVNISSNAPGDITSIISLLNGTYNATNDSFVVNFNTKISKYSEQLYLLNLVLDAINQIKNEN